MTLATYRNPMPSRAAFGPLRAQITTLLERVKDARARRAVYTQTMSELGSLSARELADIGIHHSQIRRIAIDAANKEVPHA